ncbi:MAG: GNAT family N-acetyltransferase [Cyanobacteria bacterium J06621_3]
MFVIEQNVQCLDADGLDIDAWHIFSQSKAGEIVAYARLLAPHTRYPEPSIGRVLVRKSARGEGIGHQLVSFCLEKCNEIYPEHAICISAQAHLEKFYQYFGFKSVGEAYDDAGIPHRMMIKAEA